MEFSRIEPSGNPPENYLIFAILMTIFCCWPVGIFAILKATKVRELWAMGDEVGAQKAADDAKKLTIWGAVAAFVLIIIPVIILFSMGIFATLMDAA
ncbi:CD225/dispanin family protein [Aequorivita sp. F47161]|uniref:CD225/dispanin family protein n=1 Tax=Aequorivita vitellina TaxID=2874475 RepID=A0A9X1U417_9FLAO|nr:CD225/dispanin family protein [Aequorivita vitellina]MCG2420123.1 CD225/dispanin family protein [Aequorivita vitellina]